MKSTSLMAGLLMAAALAFTGCATNQSTLPAAAADKGQNEMVILREGDSVKISFPSSPNLDTTQQIRRDGKINLTLVGEVDAKGLTPDALQKKLIDLYAPQISSKEISVSVASSTFPVFVNGQVIHPGKVLSDHPLTALEAIMEAGGYDANTANLKAVKVIRNENGKLKNYRVNLQDILDGKSDQPFYLQPNDIVVVPERFQMF
ncbi:MAG TPA: polysaccharide biosynthesis/export family protein [Candidatus Acidoferrales bacterium]|nr:polysaccharide biosynthesis/export family protein [Candidatus Acidoferrales bacterium]